MHTRLSKCINENEKKINANIICKIKYINKCINSEMLQ